jgi:branched-chain amino acid transport system ATP-binding protein
MTLLEISDIAAGYEGSNILQNISLSVAEGSVVSLLGRNGAGKTTTLRTIIGLLNPTAGVIQFNGKDITTDPPHAVYEHGIGLVTEDRGIFPDLTVGENLRVPNVGSDGRNIEELYEFFPKLRELNASTGKNLSGGEKQMLAIARALRSNPRLLLLDEPSEGLAPQIVEDVGQVIQKVAEAGTTVLLVEQNVEFALAISEYTYIMDSGQIVFEGTDADVRASEDEVEGYLGVRKSQ